MWLRSPHANNANNEYNINTSGASNNNNASNAYAFQPDNALIGDRVNGVGPAEKRKAMHWERVTMPRKRRTWPPMASAGHGWYA